MTFPLFRRADFRAAPRHRRVRWISVTTVALLIAGFIQIVAAPAALAVGPDLARFGTVTASAAQNDQDGNFPAANVIDGDPSTRWASGNGPNSADSVFTSWLQVDLGAPAAIDRVGLIWEAAYAVKYTLQVATADPTEEASWTTISSVDSGNGGTDEVLPDAPVAARYVRVNMLERFHGWSWGDNWYGYSLYSLEVNGVASATSVGFSSAAQSTPAGIDAPIQLLLNQAAAQDVSVRLRSTGGSAVAGTDFQAIDRTITFPAGATTASVPVVSVDHGPLAPVRTIELALSEPSNGLVLSAAATSTLTLRPHGDTSSVGDSLTIADFEGGGIGTVFPWGSDASAQPVLTLVDGSSVPDAASTNHALNAAVAAVPAGGWSGFSNDIDAPADWSAYDGFSFWFLGTGSGRSAAVRTQERRRRCGLEHSVRALGGRRHRWLAADHRPLHRPAEEGRADGRRALRPGGGPRLRGHPVRPRRRELAVRRLRCLPTGLAARGLRRRRSVAAVRQTRSASSRGATRTGT